MTLDFRTDDVGSGSSNLEGVTVGLIRSGRTLAGRMPITNRLENEVNVILQFV